MYVHMNTKHTLLQTKNEACCSRDKISSINIVHFLGGRGGGCFVATLGYKEIKFPLFTS